MTLCLSARVPTRFYQRTTLPFQYSTFSRPSVFIAPSVDWQTVLARLNNACFYLCPYFSPYVCSPPSGIFRRSYEAFKYLQQLSETDKTLFLSAYRDYRHANAAHKNPTAQTNIYWQWVVKFELSPWEIKKLIIDKPYESSPTSSWTDNPRPWWSQQRMGQTVTKLEDGRTLYIGGEYEDYYDPDFYIYNDVIVRHPDGHIEIYGYPRAVFPPTDFHTATLVGDYIY
ncbi:MAG: hypothetical protein Q4P13_08575, partial [Psychrobacter sp.]|nr:hypothetical protein [Psychrobacter sp.]